MFIHSEELTSSALRVELHIGEDGDRDQCKVSRISPEGDEEMSGQPEENSAEGTCLEHMRPGRQSSTGVCDDMKDKDFKTESIWRSAISDRLEEYMDECCQLSEVRSS